MPRPDVSSERKNQILEAAIQVITQKGIDAARMEDIAQAAGLSVGGVYWYYKGKDEVILAIMESVIDPDLAGLREPLGEGESLQSQMEGFIRDRLDQALRLMPITYELYSLAGRNEQLRARLRAYFLAYREALAGLIRQAAERGEIKAVDAEQVALTFSALYEGFLELAYLDRSAFDPAQALMHSLNLIMDGLKK
jgi:AcrR family transcriptional regulator